MSAHTPGPWQWAKMGDWKLIGNHGMRPIVLSCWGVRKAPGPPGPAVLKLRNSERDLLMDFDPEHPDANLIAAAPDLLAALKDVVASAAPNAHEHPAMFAAWQNAAAAIAKADDKAELPMLGPASPGE